MFAFPTISRVLRYSADSLPLLQTDEGTAFGLRKINTTDELVDSLVLNYVELSKNSSEELVSRYSTEQSEGCPYSTGDGVLPTGIQDKVRFDSFFASFATIADRSLALFSQFTALSCNQRRHPDDCSSTQPRRGRFTILSCLLIPFRYCSRECDHSLRRESPLLLHFLSSRVLISISVLCDAGVSLYSSLPSSSLACSRTFSDDFSSSLLQEVAYVFSNPLKTANTLGTRPGDAELAKLMTSQWVSFIHDLTPNNNGSKPSVVALLLVTKC